MSQVSYTNDNARYEAYQFSDPFATSSFVCCNKKLNKVCRPNCDYYPKVSSKEDVSFMFDANQAISIGFQSCEHCDPCNPNSQLDLPLIKITIESINYSIGFTNDANDLKRRAFSVPSINTNNGHYDRQLTRNESEHIKLVELACRHIAAAAALSISKQAEESSTGGKKKRRGGVLGFKELASKSKLSPWHFHRVFKSVTGLTPKSYGDQCWKFIKDHDRPPTKRQRSYFKSVSDISNNFQAPKKNVKVEEDVAPTAPAAPMPMNHNMSSIPEASIMPQQQQQQVPPIHNQTTQQYNQLPLSNDLFDLNKNSLDINLQPLRHHSLDLGALALDLGDFNKMEASLSPSSSFIPLTSNNLPLNLQQIQQEVPSQQYNNNGQNSSSSHSSTDLSSLSLNPLGSTNGGDAQWPTLEGSTPATQEEVSRLLTPPSSVGEVDFQQKVTSAPSQETEMYDVLNKSPLDTDDFLNFDNSGDYALLNDASNEVGAGLFLGTDGNEIFNEMTTFKSQGDNLMI